MPLMSRAELECSILESHKQLMIAVESEDPGTAIRARVVCIDGRKATLAVISSTAKLRVSRMLEETVFAKQGGKEAQGTVVDAFESMLVVQFDRRMKVNIGNELCIRCHSNHNNEVLLRAAEHFFASEKAINPSILECYVPTSKHSRHSQAVSAVDAVEFYNASLNDAQKSAVHASLHGSPFKILGPPGTGKTETIVEMIAQNLARQKTVLVCGPSNIAIDNIIERFILSGFNTRSLTPFYRLGSSFKGLTHFNLEHLASEAVAFMEKEDNEVNFAREVQQRRQEFIAEYRRTCPVVFATLFSSLKEPFFFDLCIVDEACQATQLECFMGCVKARSFILVGDPNQLCPAASSLYEHLDLPVLVLNRQYRMHRDLLAFSNEYFYGNVVESPKADEFLFFGQSKILFIDTSYFEYAEEHCEMSKKNEKEAVLVQKVVGWLSRGMEKDIGVITPYSGQVRLLREIVGVPVETVDGFQGREKDFIVLSLVRSNEESQIGFLSDAKRLNVAITRCRKGLVVIADAQNFVRDAFFRQFFRFLENCAYVVDPETFMAIASS